MQRKVILFLVLSIGLIQTVLAQEATNLNQRGYLLAPGDIISVNVLGEKDFNFETALDENGNVQVPFFEEPLPAMCKNERELRADVSKLLSKYLRAPQVALNIKERKSRPPTTVHGAVRNPQAVVLMRQVRLSELLAIVGGVNEDAGGMVQLVRPQAPLCGSKEEITEWNSQVTTDNAFPIKMYSLGSIRMQSSDDSNPIIYPGDIVEVEKGKPVYLVGEVKGGQGGLMIKERGLTLFNALSMVGGPNREAKTKDIKIYRQKKDSIERDVIAVNYDLIRKGEQKDIPLEPYDIIEVDKANKSIGQLVLEIATGSARMAAQSFATSGVRVIY